MTRTSSRRGVPVRALSTLCTIIASSLLLHGCSGSGDGNSALPESATAQLTILETTDLHANVLSYDYFKLAEDKSVGFERTATLIRQARVDYPNSVLIDNGDTIQGTALADYQALVTPVSCSQKLATYKAMDSIGYDAGTLGNHEFNYGLPYLAQVTGARFNVDGMAAVSSQASCAGPDFPLVLSNVTSKKDGQTLYKPYVILTRKIKGKDKDGKDIESTVKVAVIGFTPPPILSWDKRWLDGKVDVQGVVEAAQKYVPMARADGADLVIAASHGGYDSRSYSATMENANYHLAKVAGIDGILMGHSHNEFPNATCTTSDCNASGVDKVKGTLHGVPAVMPSYWGKALGVINYGLVVKNGKWTIDTSKTQVSLRKTLLDATAKTYAAVDPTIAAAVRTEHESAIAYVKTPIGQSDFNLSSYFADVGDVSAIQVVNAAQADYVSKYVAANLPAYKSLPVLSVSAPFKSGFAGGTDFTDVKAGGIAINNAADLYLYPNTVYAVKVTGAGIKAWLEKAAERFNQINPALTTEQPLISTFPGYNFDVFTSADVSYEIDVTQAKGSRIKNLNYKGAPIDATAEFIIATNNYRGSGGGGFPGLDGSNVIYASPDANRDVLIEYIKARKNLSLATDGAARSWRFTKVTTAGPVSFKSAGGKLATAQTLGLGNISVISDDDGSGKGLGVYAIDLSK
ncbi:bifunctional 2',3'-cyclic-nucleotide 2'-phosphodiesterase/3'-nucleotidase [Zoogloea dura]|uniref:Bifunctional 2',3'-cyclic-nucleotide 2'-phosphodiesterase/3'-nucleotidase n=1 Tax=Zoogloea dura TaxID=2728840 RepID=A0A848GBA5_9RHOO|nr:bifunctional 2',3'-cyclic-nucleotide 2'-phosphodiesterase/3'-nucleotidase [Zoogloea dura]NML28412.1 bifunctional 2',3'-cyclic-nucleotide 2'-phosphodiesterase/3'-nucleotidase [Zoogloea dura]